ncbi:uncharacterized protein [Chelonus insularis]|uniref:uncharacterized protein isoform X2 n=1 Tax=Chelonus insularis TaxID=460826 RepID=UPI00158A45F0|nr:uncharacterized protein LOC118070298 isoform X2 [Chelonus insularis]
MTSIGRGRGWGKTSNETSAPLRRPGQQTETNQLANTEETDEWIQKIQELDINDSDSIFQTIKSVLLETSHEDEACNNRVTKLINKALEDKEFAVKFMAGAKDNFSPRFLQPLQSHYMNFSSAFFDREKMTKENIPQFMNLTYLLSEIIHNVSTTNRALRDPLVDCCKMLLELGGEEEIELVATSISLNGRMLHSKLVKCLPEVNFTAREILATRNLSSRSRVLLMLIIDLFHNEFMPLSGGLQNFYVKHLGQSTLLKMQTSSQKSENVEGILMQLPSNQKPQPKKHSPKNLSSQNNPGPRAIRGSGATKNKDYRDFKKFSDKRDKNNDNVWTDKHEGNNQSWNHDDRFSKDY